ncbi:hypothetical protein ABZ816_15665 [Actinosynnema sp. NPDC047251]|uniref:hypothetical protein n=1 Tax=Saccharothrix espanaensis TaxID=103731 RepID=UPI0002FCCD54|nr:hypothetical protein [Saccharothrix espanaensis]
MPVPARIAAALLGIGMSTLIASPAVAAEPDADTATGSPFGDGVDAAGNWAFSAADVCLQELAVVPAGGQWNGNHADHCANGNVIDHPEG